MRRKKIIISLLSVLSFLSVAKTIPAPETALKYIGSALWSKMSDIRVVGNLAYCSCRNGLMIVDLADKKNPKLLSTLYLGGGNAIEIQSGFAYIAAGKKGLHVVNVKDPRKPVSIAGITFGDEARSVALTPTHAFVAAADAGLQVVDIRKPGKPVRSGALVCPGNAENITISGSYAYIASGDAGLQIVDIRNPRAPRQVSLLNTPGKAEYSAVSSPYIYVADGSSGLQIIDIHNPVKPALVSNFATVSYARSVKILGNRACVTSIYEGGCQFLDISDPRAPALRATVKYTMYNETWNAELKENYAYLIDWFTGLSVFSLVDLHNPELIGQFLTPGSVLAANVQKDSIIAAGELSAIHVLDLANPAVLPVTAATGMYRFAFGVAVKDKTVYMSSRSGIIIFSLTPDGQIKEASAFMVPGIPRAMAIQDDYLFVTSDHKGLFTIDIRQPLQPKIIGSLKMPGISSGLALRERYAYLANNDTGFHIIDIQQPETLRQIGSCKTQGMASAVSLKDTCAWVADGDSGMQVIDISDPASPKKIGSFATKGFCSAVAVKGDWAFLGDEKGGVTKLDIRNLISPKAVSSFPTPGIPVTLFFQDDDLIVCDTYSLIVLK